MQVTRTIGDPTRDGVQDRRGLALAEGAQQREAMDRDIRKGCGEVGQDAEKRDPRVTTSSTSTRAVGGSSGLTDSNRIVP